MSTVGKVQGTRQGLRKGSFWLRPFYYSAYLEFHPAAAALIQQGYKYWQPCYVLALGQDQGAMADELQHTRLVFSIKSKAWLDRFVSIFVGCIFHLVDKLCGKGCMIYWQIGSHDCDCKSSKERIGLTSCTRKYNHCLSLGVLYPLQHICVMLWVKVLP